MAVVGEVDRQRGVAALFLFSAKEKAFLVDNLTGYSLGRRLVFSLPGLCLVSGL